MIYYYSDQDIADRKANAGNVSIRRFPAWAKLVSDLITDVKKMPTSNGKVALVGFSNGGNLSAHATPQDPNIDAAVIYYGGGFTGTGFLGKSLSPAVVFFGEGANTQ